MIPFTTNINFGLNFFGWPLGAGDSSYDSSHFATKIRSVGVWFSNYKGIGGGFSNTPRVYLIPVGSDVLRSPSGTAGTTREWKILDQTLPVPLPITPADLVNAPEWVPMIDTLGAPYAGIRRQSSFRAFHDGGSFNSAETAIDSRLIGRSVWNNRWLLIIPAGTLHYDRNEALERFINGALMPDGTREEGGGISDILIYFQTYAYSGN